MKPRTRFDRDGAGGLAALRPAVALTADETRDVLAASARGDYAEADRIVEQAEARVRRDGGMADERRARLDMISRLADAPWSTK